jgi:hypothetical protein
MKKLFLSIAILLGISCYSQDYNPDPLETPKELFDVLSQKFIDEGVREGVVLIDHEEWEILYDYASTGNNSIGAIRYDDGLWDEYSFPGYKILSISYRGTTIHFFAKVPKVDLQRREG